MRVNGSDHERGVNYRGQCGEYGRKAARHCRGRVCGMARTCVCMRVMGPHPGERCWDVTACRGEGTVNMPVGAGSSWESSPENTCAYTFGQNRVKMRAEPQQRRVVAERLAITVLWTPGAPILP